MLQTTASTPATATTSTINRTRMLEGDFPLRCRGPAGRPPLVGLSLAGSSVGRSAGGRSPLIGRSGLIRPSPDAGRSLAELGSVAGPASGAPPRPPLGERRSRAWWVAVSSDACRVLDPAGCPIRASVTATDARLGVEPIQGATRRRSTQTTHPPSLDQHRRTDHPRAVCSPGRVSDNGKIRPLLRGDPDGPGDRASEDSLALRGRRVPAPRRPVSARADPQEQWALIRVVRSGPMALRVSSA